MQVSAMLSENWPVAESCDKSSKKGSRPYKARSTAHTIALRTWCCVTNAERRPCVPLCMSSGKFSKQHLLGPVMLPCLLHYSVS